MINRIGETGREHVREVVSIAVGEQVTDDGGAPAVGVANAGRDVQQRHIEARVRLKLRVNRQQRILDPAATFGVDRLDFLVRRTPLVHKAREPLALFRGGPGAFSHLADALAHVQRSVLFLLRVGHVPRVIAHQVAVNTSVGELLHQVHILRRHLLRARAGDVRWARARHPNAVCRWIIQDVFHDLLGPLTAAWEVGAVPHRNVGVDRATHLQDRHDLHATALTDQVECRHELLGVRTTDHVHRLIGVDVAVRTFFVRAVVILVQNQHVIFETDLATIGLRRREQWNHVLVWRCDGHEFRCGDAITEVQRSWVFQRIGLQLPQLLALFRLVLLYQGPSNDDATRNQQDHQAIDRLGPHLDRVPPILRAPQHVRTSRTLPLTQWTFDEPIRQPRQQQRRRDDANTNDRHLGGLPALVRHDQDEHRPVPQVQCIRNPAQELHEA